MSFTPDQGTEQQADQLTFKVGEREFNAESAATKIGAADEHIGRIEQENAGFQQQLTEMQAKLDQSTKLDDALSQLKAQQTQETQNSQTTPETSGVSEEQIGAIATKQIQDYLAEQQATQSLQASELLAKTTYEETGKILESIYGDKTNEAMATKATELGVSTNELYSMAKSPATAKMLLETMKVNVPDSQAAPSGSVNMASAYHNAPEKFMDYTSHITSSNIVDALKRADATY
jgi:hypothetical protein